MHYSAFWNRNSLAADDGSAAYLDFSFNAQKTITYQFYVRLLTLVKLSRNWKFTQEGWIFSAIKNEKESSLGFL